MHSLIFTAETAFLSSQRGGVPRHYAVLVVEIFAKPLFSLLRYQFYDARFVYLFPRKFLREKVQRQNEKRLFSLSTTTGIGMLFAHEILLIE